MINISQCMVLYIYIIVYINAYINIYHTCINMYIHILTYLNRYHTDMYTDIILHISLYISTDICTDVNRPLSGTVLSYRYAGSIYQVSILYYIYSKTYQHYIDIYIYIYIYRCVSTNIIRRLSTLLSIYSIIYIYTDIC